MNLILQLPEELEAKLREQAKASGKAPEELVLLALREQFAAEPSGLFASEQTVTPEQWVTEFRAWAESHRKLPREADDSRESIYAGRGE
jgi:hypothetical protein